MDSITESDNQNAIAFLREAGAFASFYPDDVNKIQTYLVEYIRGLESKGAIKFTALDMRSHEVSITKIQN